MSMSNIEYYSLKKRQGLHNWGFLGSKDEIGFDLDELDELDIDKQGGFSLQQNDHGEYYALQDFEE